MYAWLLPLALLVARPHAQAATTEIGWERPSAGPARTTAAAPLARLDLNRAAVEDLDLLPGIGLHRARQIVARRDVKGPYRTVWELTELPGFSKALVARLEPYLNVEPNQP